MAENQEDQFADDPKVSDEEIAAVQLFKDIDPATATPEQVQQVIKTGKTLLVQKKNWRGNAKDPATGKLYKDLVAEAPAKPNTPVVAAPDDSVKADVLMLKTAEEKRQFGFKNSLSPEETDQLFAYAKGLGVNPTEALSNPFFKTALSAMRSEAQISRNTPGPSSRAPRVEGKSFSEMKPDDRRANFGKVVAGLRGGK